jgi:periplasmic protein TonB
VSGRLIVWGVVSLAIHAGAAGAGLAMLRGVMPPALFVDLVHGLLVIEEPAGPRRVAGAPPAPPAASASPRSGEARSERRTSAASPRPAPAPRVAPAETTPIPAPTPPPAVPEAVPAVVESPPVPLPPPTVVAPPPSPTVESAAPRLAGPPSEPPAGGKDSAPAAPGGSPAGGQAPPAAGAATASSERGSAGAGVPGAGGGDGALALAIPGGSGRGDTAEYDGYYALVRRRIIEALTYPAAARRRSLAGTVQVELEIQPSGVISRVEIVASSSHRVLDDAAVDTVRSVGRVPFPRNVRPRLLLMRQPIVFELR